MNPLAEAELRRQASIRDGQLPPGLTLEQLVEDRDFADLPISPVQRALCRIADGRGVDGLTLDPAQMREHLGVNATEFIQTERPRIVIVRSGRRAGKTLIAVLGGLILGALTCQMRRPTKPGERAAADGMIGVRPGEFVRAVIIAPRMQQTRGAFMHAVAALKNSKRLKQYVVPGTDNATSITIRRPDGHKVVIEILAAGQRGTGLRGSWFAGAVIDEADFFDEDDAAVSLHDQLDAIRPGLCTGAQVWVVSSPWSDDGRFYKMHAKAFGNPGKDVAFHSASIDMNPMVANEVDIPALRAADPEFVAREYDAIPMTSAGQAFFPKAAIIATCVRTQHTLPPDNSPHWGGGDLAFVKNSSAVAFAKSSGGKVVLSAYDEMIPEPGIPLKPSVVCEAWAKLALLYRANSIMGDNLYKATALEELPKTEGVGGRRVVYEPWPSSEEANVFTEFRRLMIEGLLDLPSDPRLIKQLEDTKVRKMTNGKTGVLVPKHGLAHGDLMYAVVLACTQVPLDGSVAHVWSNDPGDAGAFRFAGQRGF